LRSFKKCLPAVPAAAAALPLAGCLYLHRFPLPLPTLLGMWRTSVSEEHVRLFFAIDDALRAARSDEHTQVRVQLAELRAAMDGGPGASSAAAAKLIEACAEAGVAPTPLASPPGQSRPNEQGAQEVVPGLWIAPVFPVETRSWLEAARVTHVVDATGGWRRVVSALENTWERRQPCFPELAEYLVLDAEDKPGFPLDEFFERSNAFIEAALRTPAKGEPANVVVVHCHSGVSRSTTLVMAFLMSRHGLGLQEALRVVRDARPCVRPNEGFERQLARHEMRLRVAARQGKRARDEERAAAGAATAGTGAATSPAAGPAAAPGGGGAALDETEEAQIRSLPTDVALARLCGHMGSVAKFSQVAGLLEARLGTDLTPQTAAAFHEALRKVWQGHSKKGSKGPGTRGPLDRGAVCSVQGVARDASLLTCSFTHLLTC